MRSALLLILIVSPASVFAEVCSEDPVDAFMKYQNAFYSMKSHDDLEILNFLTKSAGDRFKEMAAGRNKSMREGGEVLKWNESIPLAEREKKSLEMMKAFRGERPRLLYPQINKSDKGTELLYRWSTDVYTSVKESESTESRTDHEFKATLICESGWKLEVETHTAKTFEKTMRNGKLFSHGSRSAGFGYMFP